MLSWYKKLYIGHNAEKKKKQLMYKINVGIGVFDVYLITLACNSQNQLEIFSANELKQKARRKYCPMIIGMCCGYEEALEMTRMLVEEAYRETGIPDVRKWLENKMKEEGSR